MSERTQKELYGSVNCRFFRVLSDGEGLERSLLEDFDQCYKKKDLHGMQRVAHLLFAFNGANSCVQMYISQNAFFLARNNEPDEDLNDS